MFTVKLGTGGTFEVDTVNESYRISGIPDDRLTTLTFQVNDTKHNLAYYRDMVNADGALDNIQVLSDDKVVMETKNYSMVSDLLCDLMPSGQWRMTLVLMETIAEEKTGSDGE